MDPTALFSGGGKCLRQHISKVPTRHRRWPVWDRALSHAVSRPTAASATIVRFAQQQMVIALGPIQSRGDCRMQVYQFAKRIACQLHWLMHNARPETTAVRLSPIFGASQLKPKRRPITAIIEGRVRNHYPWGARAPQREATPRGGFEDRILCDCLARYRSHFGLRNRDHSNYWGSC